MRDPEITNRSAGGYVRRKQAFQGSNLYAERRGGTYVVFSYGEHFPLFIHRSGEWFENADRYSVTTARHRSYAHPHTPTEMRTTQEMRALLAQEDA